MKASGLKSIAMGIASAALLLGLATTGRAALVIEQTGPPELTGSWVAPFIAHGVTFDAIAVTASRGVFESPGLTAGWSAPLAENPVSGWSTTGDTLTFASISGPAANFLPITTHFLNTPGTTPPFILDFTVFNQGVPVGETALKWVGTEFDVVPEPSTLLVGALLLLPFGLKTLRNLRGNREA